MPLGWIILAPVIMTIPLLYLLMFRRIPAEDEILGKAFGKEWDEWARIELCQEFIDAESLDSIPVQ